MKSIYLSTENFHIATEQERKEIRKSQCHNFILCWFKRFFITFILAGVVIAFQILARETIPYNFKPYQTKERMIVLVVCIFAVFNILSLIQLLIHNYIAFNIRRALIISSVVKKKITVDEIISIFQSVLNIFHSTLHHHFGKSLSHFRTACAKYELIFANK